MASPPLYSFSAKRGPLLVFAFLFLHMLVVFREVWPADTTLDAQDYNIGLMAMYKSEMPGSLFTGFWRDMPLLGRAGHTPPTFTHLLLALLPVHFYFDWIYGLCLLGASLFFAAFLRRKGLGWTATAFGALVAFWTGSNLTLAYPGHLDKFAVLLFASATLCGMERALATRSSAWALFTGGSAGMMFMQQGDLALFFAIPLGAWAVMELLCANRPPPSALMKMGVLAFLPAVLMLFQAYRFAMETQVRNVAALTESTPEERWEFLTQWSHPPEESVDFIAPGFSGWRTNHETRPYAGRMGRSASWDGEATGLPNFKLENRYIGVIPLALAVFALTARPRSRETRFWFAVACVSLLLAFGRFTPLYASFARLPLISSIRNPNKFLQVFQFAVGLLAARGLDAFLRPAPRPSLHARLCPALALTALSLGTAALLMDPRDPLLLLSFHDTPWAAHAENLVAGRRAALFHATLLSLVLLAAAGLTRRFHGNSRAPLVIGISLLLVTAADGLLLARHHLLPHSTRFLQDNALADFLEEHATHQRVAVLEHGGIYSEYLSHLFHYRGIAFADVTAAPRLGTDYRNYLSKAGQNPIRLWREFGVSHVLARRETARALTEDPDAGALFQEVFAYDLAEDLRGGLRIVPSGRGREGDHVVLEFLLPSDRFTLLANWEESDGGFLTDFATHAPDPGAGEILGIERDPRGFDLHFRVDAPAALLRLSDRHDPRIRFITQTKNQETHLSQVDGLFTGAVFSKGEHHVTLRFKETHPGPRLQLAGVILWLVGTPLAMVFGRRR